MTKCMNLLAWKLLGGLVCFTAVTVCSAPVTFTLDPARSSVTGSGTVAGIPMQEQAPGSMQTTFSGTLQIDLTASSLQIIQPSSVDANTNGVWEPAVGGEPGRAPADFAGRAVTPFGSAKGALRNILLAVASGPIPLNNGSFTSTGIVFSFSTNAPGTFDYEAGALGFGSVPLTGQSTNRAPGMGAIASNGAAQTITIPIDVTYPFTAMNPNDSQIRLVGQLVAVSAPAAPRITSIRIVNGQVRIEAEGADDTFRLESSTDLRSWATRAATASTEGNLRVYTFAPAGQREFFRLVKP